MSKNWYQETRKNIDYLEIKLFGQDIKDKLTGLTENSLTRTIKTDYNKYIIQYRASFSQGLYVIFDIFIAEVDNKPLKQQQLIGSINRIKNKQMSKNGVYFTLSGEFWNKYDLNYFMDIIEGMQYQHTKYMWAIYRVDFKIDIFGVNVQTLYDNLDFEKIKLLNIPLIKTGPRKALSYFRLDFSEDALRVYNKKKDILDKGKEDNYIDYVNFEGPITRIEIQLNRKKFAKKLIKDIFDLFDYGEDALAKKMKKYFVYDFKTSDKLNGVQFDSTRKEHEIKEKEKNKFNRKMLEVYLKKVFEYKYNKKYLKNLFDNYIKEIYDN